MTLFLASRSRARHELLSAAGIAFEPIDSSADEEAIKATLRSAGLAPRQLAVELAIGKATGAKVGQGDMVIGADQILEQADGTTLDKPASIEQAADQLRSLFGQVHYLHSSACLVRDGRTIWSGTETAELQMRRPSDSFLRDYLEREYPHVSGNVGAYRIEGPGIALFERISGSYHAILGLPLLPLLEALRDQGLLER